MSTVENEVAILKGMLRRAAELLKEQEWMIHEAEKGNTDSIYRSARGQASRVHGRLKTDMERYGITV